MKARHAASWLNGRVPIIESEYLATVLAAASDITFLVARDGVINSVLMDESQRYQKRLEDWVGLPMSDVLTSESIPKLERALSETSEVIDRNRQIELNHSDGKGPDIPIKYSFHKAGPDDSILMLGKDQSVVSQAQEQLVQAQVALERGYEERRQHDARYRMVMARTQDAFVFVSSDGKISDLNAAAAKLLDADVDQLIGTRIDKEVSTLRGGDILDRLVQVAASDFETDLEVKTSKSQRNLKLEPSIFRTSGHRLFVCRLSTSLQEERTDMRLRTDMEALFNKSTDAFVICDSKGLVINANESFLELAGLGSMSDLKSRNLGDFLQRGQIDLKVLLESTLQTGHMRIFSTRLMNSAGAQSAVEISSVLLHSKEELRVVFVLRDADRAATIRQATQSANSPEMPNQNVVELVGSATLKEIVSETNDVIEKICIETAVNLTGNNRAAAAEMLGVSRQSLYVKLRKYGLLRREDT